MNRSLVLLFCICLVFSVTGKGFADDMDSGNAHEGQWHAKRQEMEQKREGGKQKREAMKQKMEGYHQELQALRKEMQAEMAKVKVIHEKMEALHAQMRSERESMGGGIGQEHSGEFRVGSNALHHEMNSSNQTNPGI